jgi:predicted DNA-binding transcriptional regulator AlpA
MTTTAEQGPRVADLDTPTRLLTRAEVAQMLRVSPKRLANLACAGLGPDFVRFPGGNVRYELATIEAYIARHRCKASA